MQKGPSKLKVPFEILGVRLSGYEFLLLAHITCANNNKQDEKYDDQREGIATTVATSFITSLFTTHI